MVEKNTPERKKKIIEAFKTFESQKRLEVEDPDGRLSWEAYQASVGQFAYELGLDFDDELAIEDFHVYLHRYLATLDARLIKLELGNEEEITSGPSLRISSDYKIEIHERLVQIRKIVASANLEVQKRDKIFDWISLLGREVDKEKTTLGTIMANMLDITKTAGEAAENLDPLIKRIESLFKLFADAKEDSEMGQIEQEDRKMIEGPKEESGTD